ncbi:MAG TPA: M48 family metalloprotease [Terriglobales bacterium]|nr:M48 family metalloprotease [Terriglobales bacterium]
MPNIFERSVFARIAQWVCLAVMPMFAAEVGAAQVVASADSNDEPVVALAGRGLPTDEAAGKLSRKYDLTRVGNRGIGGGFDLYSVEKEQRLGEKWAAALDRTVRRVRDPETANYVGDLCQKVSSQSDNRFPLTVKIIESDEANIYALPGGILYVTTGLFVAVDSEAELAGVISHEIAHIAARHVTKMAARRSLWKVLTTPVMFLPFGGLAIQISDVAVPMKLNRNAELEADLLGLQYMYLAGYDPSEFLRFLDRGYATEDRRLSRMAQIFSDFPSLNSRLGQDRIMVSTFPPREEYVVDTSGFAEMKTKYAAPEPKLLRRGKRSTGPRLRRRTQSTAGGNE